jgi:hypothetical protein
MAAGLPGSVRLTAALSLAAAVLAVDVPNADASPVFTDALTQLTGGAGSITIGPPCTQALSAPSPAPVPVVENGPAASLTQSATATFGRTGSPNDTASASATTTIAAQLTSANGSMRTIDVTGQGSGQLQDNLPVSACPRALTASANLNTEFAIAQPGIVTIHLHGDGSVSGGMSIFVGASLISRSADVSASGLPQDSLVRLFVQPGTYTGNASVGTNAGGGTSSASIAGTVAMQMSFAAAGSQSAAASGKAAAYVSFPAARSCAGHAVVPTMTAKKSKVRKIKQVAFFLGTHRVAKVKKPKAGAGITVPLPDTEDEVVRAEVTLLPKHKGQKPKTVSATASYVACAV